MSALRIMVTGIVQGVGFRPFLHRLAARHGLTGWARNTSSGVELQWQGSPEALARAVAELQDEACLPPLAQVDAVRTEPCETEQTAEFRILPSVQGDAPQTLVSPDIASCLDCLRELFDAADRRYHYPFLNCTNCGPRFTIQRTVPYDRANTTMAKFALCKPCAGEYARIEDRRYHAQPTCCPDCGPRLWFADAAGSEQPEKRPGDAIAAAQKLLQSGGILAVKGLGGFHLAVPAENEAAVQRLRTRKHREAKPLAVMVPNAECARRFARMSAAERRWLESPRSPIVLLEKHRPDDWPWLSENSSIGVLLPYTPVHHLLFADAGFSALVMTSANHSDVPAMVENAEAVRQLQGIADGFLLNDRDIEARCDDSLLRVPKPDTEREEAAQPYFIRRSRGFAPQPISLPFTVNGLLALGAEQKASFALGRAGDAFYSQHIGDLKNAETLEHYETQLKRFEALFGVQPKQLICDLHPDFLSTNYAQQRAKAQDLPLVQVQHHHAHMASCMADNRLEGECIGLVWDGTGLGTDGTIWGGEWLVGGYAAARRAVSLRPVRLPGGDAAIREIGRIGYALAWDAGGEELFSAPMPAAKRQLLSTMLQKNLNCPLSSGMGRLFDGVYALLSGCETAAYEGQGAVLLEHLADKAPEESGYWPPEFYRENGLLRFDTRPMIRALLTEQRQNVPAPVLAARFHNTMVELAAEGCRHVRTVTGLTRVVLSGGVFFNQILLRKITQRLSEEGFAVYCHRRVSTGDEGIALGQLAVAAHRT